MALNVRRKQIDSLLKLLHFNEAFKESAGAEERFKVLVIDEFTLKVVATLLHTEVLRKHGVTLVLTVDKDREAIADAPAVYFLQANPENAANIVRDIEGGLYKEMHVNFTPWAPRQLLESVAAGAVKSGTQARVAKVFDQYLSFIALEAGLFTLGLPESYMHLNDNRAAEADILTAVTSVVEGLFSVCVTLGTVPIIRCAPGGLSQHIAEALAAKMCDHLKGRGASLFSEGGLSLASSSRPLLCLFDRNFDLIPMVEQPFTYKALVHDVLGLRLNKVDVRTAESAGQAAKTTSIEVGEDDAFWDQNGHLEFGAVASEVDVQLKKYQEVMASVSARTGGSTNSNPDADEQSMIQDATKALMTTVKSLPQLRAQKRKLDNHMTLLYSLLNEIKERKLNKVHDTAQALLSGSGDFKQVLEVLEDPVRAGSVPSDNLRLALVYLLVAEKLPSDAELTKIQTALQASGVDMEAFFYVKRMRQMRLTGRQGPDGFASTASNGASSLLGYMDNSLVSGLAGQFSRQVNNITKLIGGARQALMVSAVSSLMDPKPGQASSVDDYIVLDPKAQAGKASADAAKGPFREAIVFVIGGGNYLEQARLSQWALSCTPPKRIIYGTTEMLSGAEFCAQLAVLGKNSVGASSAAQ